MIVSKLRTAFALAFGFCGLGPATICAASNEMLVSSFFSDSVHRYDLQTGQYVGTLAAPAGLLDGALAARVGPDGLLYVVSEEANCVLRFAADTFAYVDTFVTPGSGGLLGPSGVCWGPDGNLFVSSFDSDTILRYNGATGAFLNVFVAAGSGGLNGPDNGTIFGPDGNLYVPSYFTNRIIKYNGSTGAFMSVPVPSIGRPRVLVFRSGKLYVTSETGDSVRRYNGTTGAFETDFVAPGSGGLDEPVGMAFGEDGYLYVTSGTLDRVLRFDATTGAYVNDFVPAGDHGIDGPVFLTRVVVACNPAACPADITGGCAVNIDDLLAVINAWSLTGKSGADVTGDDLVDIDDLLAVINAWGPCA
jgi:streptogramin lyase